MSMEKRYWVDILVITGRPLEAGVTPAVVAV
jgi:hypothetical protein